MEPASEWSAVCAAIKAIAEMAYKRGISVGWTVVNAPLSPRVRVNVGVAGDEKSLALGLNDLQHYFRNKRDESLTSYQRGSR